MLVQLINKYLQGIIWGWCVIPEELEQDAIRIAKAVEAERLAGELRAERIANATNAATIERAAEAAMLTKAVEEARCKQLSELKGTMTVYQWAIGILFGVLMFMSGSFLTMARYMPQIAINTDKINTITATYPKQFEEIHALLIENGQKLDTNNENIANIKLAMSQHIAMSRKQ